MAYEMNIYLLVFFISSSSSSIFGPAYPITASLFNSRISESDWNTTLAKFAKEGGDTVWLKTSPFVRRTKEYLQNDPVFKLCKTGSGSEEVDCFQHAENELTSKGLHILSFASYQYEEDYSGIIAKCPQYDKKIKSTNTYFRIVLPATNSTDMCRFEEGSSVVVLFTFFRGVDSNKILIDIANKRNMTVYFGLPETPKKGIIGTFDTDLMPAYFEWIKRVVEDHKARYQKRQTSDDKHIQDKYTSLSASSRHSFKGYYSSDNCSMAAVDGSPEYIVLYSTLANIVNSGSTLTLAISPTMDLSKFSLNKTIKDHVNGLAILASTSVGVIAVHEGRGDGKGSYYWPTEIDQPIRLIDPTLDKILNRTVSQWKVNGTFRDGFTGSNHDLFSELSKMREKLSENGQNFELWLNIEAYEDLNDDICLAISPGKINMNTKDRSSKQRIDRALTHQASSVQKAIAFSWDPDFICKSKAFNSTLSDDIYNDRQRPMVVDCFLHSSQNRSVVVLGFNLDGETQGFGVEWPDRDGKRHKSGVYGYYFELDYGIQHGLIPSMEYVQMFDPYDVMGLADKGMIRVKADGSNYGCEFHYDFTSNETE